MTPTPRLDPSLYATAATVIPVFWLGLLYQVRAYDLEKRPTALVLMSIILVTATAATG